MPVVTLSTPTLQAPGPYRGAGQARLLNANHQYFLLQNQSYAPGPSNTASVAVQLERQKSASYPFGVSYEVLFSGAPGAFQLDIQHADTDTDAAYVTMNSISAVNSNNSARVELPATWTKFARVKMTTAPANPVTATVQVSR